MRLYVQQCQRQHREGKAARDAALRDDYAWDIVEGLTVEVGQRMGGTEAEARARADENRRRRTEERRKTGAPVELVADYLAAVVRPVPAELGVSPDEIMAIGDNYNDLEMLLFAGTGVVMANAPLTLREIAGLHPTASNREDGVALAIEQFILNPQLINQ